MEVRRDSEKNFVVAHHRDEVAEVQRSDPCLDSLVMERLHGGMEDMSGDMAVPDCERANNRATHDLALAAFPAQRRALGVVGSSAMALRHSCYDLLCWHLISHRPAQSNKTSQRPTE